MDLLNGKIKPMYLKYLASDRIAVMKDGHIMQIGTPNEIYAKPQNPFVAGFIGVSNFLDCQVEAPQGGEAKVSILVRISCSSAASSSSPTPS